MVILMLVMLLAGALRFNSSLSHYVVIMFPVGRLGYPWSSGRAGSRKVRNFRNPISTLWVINLMKCKVSLNIWERLTEDWGVDD